jgi:hypothetical protein
LGGFALPVWEFRFKNALLGVLNVSLMIRNCSNHPYYLIVEFLGWLDNGRANLVSLYGEAASELLDDVSTLASSVPRKLK